jgi:hypothetical protein
MPTGRHGTRPRHIPDHPEASTAIAPTRLFVEMERTRIEPVTSDLQIPGSEAKLGQVRSVKAKLCRLRQVELGYSGTRFGTRFCRCSAPVLQAVVGRQDARAGDAYLPACCASYSTAYSRSPDSVIARQYGAFAVAGSQLASPEAAVTASSRESVGPCGSSQW